ncbi:MAG: hypothetical protein RL681_545 [Candidatus Parcubacteria bacterium]
MVPFALSSRAFVVYLMIAVVLVVSSRYVAGVQLASLAEQPAFSASDIVSLVNASRQNDGLPELAVNLKLTQAASAKTYDMVTNQYFAHYSPGNVSPWDFFRAVGYHPYLAAGENLAMNFLSAQDAHVALMQSATHRANVLNAAFTEVGVSVRQGEFQHRPTIFIAEYFGRPRVASPTPTQKPVSEVKNAADTIRYAALADVLLSALEQVSFANKARCTALLAAAIVVLAFLFLIARTRSVPRPVAVRMVFLAIIFTAVVTVGIADENAPRVTPIAASSFPDTAALVQ